VLALWKGTIPGMCLWMSYSFIQFGTYDFLQNYHVTNVAPVLIPTSILNGAVAASAATTITYPFDIIRTQFVVQGRVLHYNSMYSFVQHSINSYGYSVFYKGLSAALLGVAPYMGFNFFLYNKMKYLITQEQHTSSILTWVRSSSWFPWEGVAGGIAGGIAKFTFYPLDTMKRRMQVQVLHSSLTHAVAEQQSLGYSRLRDCIVGMWKQEGIRAFYRGMVPTILKAVGSSAVGFVSYESAKRLLEEVLQ
jgi:solute carrier family 25 thiamine pyrophosphate transporter 19